MKVNNELMVPLVKDIMTKKVIAFRFDFSLFDAIEAFNKYQISAAPVINEHSEVIGFLSESDSIRCIVNCIFYDENRNNTIDLIMNRNFQSAQPQWDIFELENFFVSKRIRVAPVVNQEKHLLGIVARKDILQSLEKILRKLVEHKKNLKEPDELQLREKIRMIIDFK